MQYQRVSLSVKVGVKAVMYQRVISSEFRVQSSELLFITHSPEPGTLKPETGTWTMSKYNPHYWEVSVDPAVLEAVLIEPDLLSQLLGEAGADDLAQQKAQLKAEAVAQIRELIQTQLTTKQRQIVEMYFYQHKTQQEIAEALGINQQVVSKHLFGALREGRKVGGAIKKLRKLCEKLGIDPQKWV